MAKAADQEKKHWWNRKAKTGSIPTVSARPASGYPASGSPDRSSVAAYPVMSSSPSGNASPENPGSAGTPFQAPIHPAQFAAAAVSGAGAFPAALTSEITLPAFAGHDEAEVAGNFGERIERLIATATAEADAIRADAVAAVKHLRENAGLEAERIIASGKRQAAETITAGQQRAEADVKSAGESRRQAEELLANAHSEAEQLRRKAREEANQIRLEVDEHARQLLARTHDETNRDLSAARAELAELEHRKADMEGQLASLRTLLSEAVAPKLPAGIHDLFGPPAPPSADISAPLYTRRSIFTPEQPVSNPAVAENPAFENQPLEVQQELDEYHGA